MSVHSVFRTNTSVEIFTWARDTYKAATNSSMLVWMGGVCPDKVRHNSKVKGTSTQNKRLTFLNLFLFSLYVFSLCLFSLCMFSLCVFSLCSLVLFLLSVLSLCSFSLSPFPVHQMQPGIADWGVTNAAFFVVLNTVDDPSNEGNTLIFFIPCTSSGDPNVFAPYKAHVASWNCFQFFLPCASCCASRIPVGGQHCRDIDGHAHGCPPDGRGVARVLR